VKPLTPQNAQRLLFALVAVCKATRGEAAAVELQIDEPDRQAEAVFALRAAIGTVQEQNRHLFSLEQLADKIIVRFGAPDAPPPAAPTAPPDPRYGGCGNAP
jgi:hypothetical protein